MDLNVLFQLFVLNLKKSQKMSQLLILSASNVWSFQIYTKINGFSTFLLPSIRKLALLHNSLNNIQAIAATSQPLSDCKTTKVNRQQRAKCYAMLY